MDLQQKGGFVGKTSGFPNFPGLQVASQAFLASPWKTSGPVMALDPPEGEKKERERERKKNVYEKI